MKKRMLSLLLVLIMALQPCLGLTAWADDDELEVTAEPAAEAVAEPDEAAAEPAAEAEEAVVSVETGLSETADEAQLYKGWVKIRGEWYYYDANGLPLTGWIQLPNPNNPKEKVWYYCNEGRRYHSGVFEISGKKYLFGADGIMATGWVNIPYLNSETGAMQDLWYYCKSDGTAFSGWAKDRTDWYYYVDSVPYHDGIFEIGGKKYGFDKQGRMLVGWYSENWTLEDGTTTIHWFYFDKNGVAANGWVKDKTDWYYFVDGSSYFGGIYTIGGDGYYFDKTGRMLTGTITETVTMGNMSWPVYYRFDSDGKGISGWKKEGGYWYYYDKGVPANNTIVKIGGVNYGFDRNSRMSTGWLTLYIEEGGKVITTYGHFDANGKGTTGWLQNTKWYYFVEGVAQRNCVKMIGGVNYGFQQNGVMAVGWFSQKINEGGETLTIWYYFNSNGKGFTGWKKDSTNWYYLSNGASYRKGVFTIGGEKYGFDKVGKMLASKWFNDGSHDYYFGANGKAYKNGTYTIGSSTYTFDANGYLI